MNKLLSIVVPSYNQAEYIAETLDTIILQKTNEVELLVIDGKSTDGSADIIAQYSEHLDYWVSEPDRGQSHAFNKGFERATGRYLTWVNSDDLLLAGSIESFLKRVRELNYPHWIAANSIWMDQVGRVKKCTVNPGWSDVAYRAGYLSVSAPASIFSKELFTRVGGIDEKMHYAMDTDLWYKFASLGETYQTLNHYVWALRLHPGAKVSGKDFSENHPSIKKIELENRYLRETYLSTLETPRFPHLRKSLARLKRFAKVRSAFDSIRYSGRQVGVGKEL